MNQISVNEALRVGIRESDFRFYVPFFVVFSSLSLIIIFASLSLYLIFLAVALGLISSFYFTTRYLYQWQIWAFPRVANVHELKTKAEKVGLIPQWETKFFPPSPREKLELQIIADKLMNTAVVPDDSLHRDDSQYPGVLEIYYNKGYNKFGFICWTLAFLGITWLTIAAINQNETEFPTGFYVFVICFGLLSLMVSIENLNQFRATRPAIIFSEEGIQIKKTLYPRKILKNIEFVGTGLSRQLKLRFHITRIPYLIDLKDLDVDEHSLENVAEVFVRRWNTEQDLRT